MKPFSSIYCHFGSSLRCVGDSVQPSIAWGHVHSATYFDVLYFYKCFAEQWK